MRPRRHSRTTRALGISLRRLRAARPQPAHRRGAGKRRHAGRRSARSPSALPGREPRQEPGAGRCASRRSRARRAARRRSWRSPGCWRRAGHRHDPRHQAQAAPRREPRRLEFRLSEADLEAHFGRRAGRRRRRPALPGGEHEARVPLGRGADLRRGTVAAPRHPVVAAVPVSARRGAGVRRRAGGRGARAPRRALPRSLGRLLRPPARRAARALEGPPRAQPGEQRAAFRLLAFAATSLPAGYLAIINGLVPLSAAVIAAPVLGERLGGARIAGFVLGLAGVALIVNLGPVALNAAPSSARRPPSRAPRCGAGQA